MRSLGGVATMSLTLESAVLDSASLTIGASAFNGTSEYASGSIKVLSGEEARRLRPEMYEGVPEGAELVAGGGSPGDPTWRMPDDAVAVAAEPAFGGAAYAADDYDDGCFHLNGGLIELLAGLEADGGVRGPDLEDRVLRTLLFALVVLAAEKANPGTYTRHLERMAKFIKASQLSGRKVLAFKVSKVLTNGKPAPFTEQEARALFWDVDQVCHGHSSTSDVWAKVEARLAA